MLLPNPRPHMSARGPSSSPVKKCKGALIYKVKKIMNFLALNRLHFTSTYRGPYLEGREPAKDVDGSIKKAMRTVTMRLDRSMFTPFRLKVVLQFPNWCGGRRRRRQAPNKNCTLGCAQHRFVHLLEFDWRESRVAK